MVSFHETQFREILSVDYKTLGRVEEMGKERKWEEGGLG